MPLYDPPFNYRMLKCTRYDNWARSLLHRYHGAPVPSRSVWA